MAFKKKSKAAASTPSPTHANPPQMGSRSDMPPTIQRAAQFKIGLTDQEQRDEFRARKTKEFPGASKEKTYGSLPGGSTLDRPAKDYQ